MLSFLSLTLLPISLFYSVWKKTRLHCVPSSVFFFFFFFFFFLHKKPFPDSTQQFYYLFKLLFSICCKKFLRLLSFYGRWRGSHCIVRIFYFKQCALCQVWLLARFWQISRIFSFSYFHFACFVLVFF